MVASPATGAALETSLSALARYETAITTVSSLVLPRYSRPPPLVLVYADLGRQVQEISDLGGAARAATRVLTDGDVTGHVSPERSVFDSEPVASVVVTFSIDVVECVSAVYDPL